MHLVSTASCRNGSARVRYLMLRRTRPVRLSRIR